MTTTKIQFTDTIDGLPPDKDEGVFIGFDAEHNPYILKYDFEAGCWYGTGNDPMHATPREHAGFLPLHFLARGTMEGFVVCYARILLIASAL